MSEPLDLDYLSSFGPHGDDCVYRIERDMVITECRELRKRITELEAERDAAFDEGVEAVAQWAEDADEIDGSPAWLAKQIRALKRGQKGPK